MSVSCPIHIAESRLPPPRAKHTGTGVLRAPTSDERVIPNGQASCDMAPWAAKRDHHSPCKRKPKIEVRAVEPGGDRGIGEIDKRGPRYPKGKNAPVGM